MGNHVLRGGFSKISCPAVYIRQSVALAFTADRKEHGDKSMMKCQLVKACDICDILNLRAAPIFEENVNGELIVTFA